MRGFPECSSVTATVLLLSVVLAGCAHREAITLHDGPLTLLNGHVLEQVSVRQYPNSQRLVVLFYRTRVSARDCKSITAEVKGVWENYLRSEADRVGAHSAQVVPEDDTLLSVGFVFKRDNQGRWDERTLRASCGPST